jgi:two-component system OmpR family sensor kinase
MMTRRLRWIGVGTLASGILIAFLIRLLAPLTYLEFGFKSDPAVLVLTITLAAALLLLGSSVLLYKQEQRKHQALLEQSAALEEERRRFILRLDHELKNPLTAIQVQLDNIEESTQKDQPSIELVRTQANRLALLTRGLRRLADLETRPLEREPIEVEELLEEVVELLQAPDRIELDIQRLPWPIPPIEGDRELLLMAFRNLVDNALIYSSDAVQLRAHHTSGDLAVDVIDTGRGIPPDELPLVTEELYRGSNVHEIPGSGLGLAIVQRIIARHGGAFELRSRTGQGTIATVHLPYEQAEPI